MVVNPTDAAILPSEITPAAVELSVEAEGALESARSYVVDCPEMREVAGEELKSIKGRIKAITAERLAITRPMDEAKKRVMDFFRKPLEALDQAEAEIKRAILSFDQAEAAKLRAEQKRLEDEARRKQEEIDRRAEEAARKIREKAEEKAAKAKSEEEAQAILDSAEEKAEERIDNRKHIHVPVVVHEETKVKGISTTTRWKVDRNPAAVDIVALAKAVAAGQVAPNLLVVDFKVADGLARSLKTHFNVPGLRAVADESISARSS